MHERLAAILVLLAAAVAPAAAQDIDLLGTEFVESEAAKHFKVRAVASHTQVTAGQTFRVALVGELEAGWVYYSPDPGPVVIAGSVKVDAGPLRAGAALWPKDKPKTVDYGEGPVTNHVYAGRFAVYVPLSVPAGAAAGEREIVVSPRGQICLKVCVNLDGPNALSAATKVTVGGEAKVNPEWTGELASGLGSAMTAGELKALHRAGGESEGKKIAKPRLPAPGGQAQAGSVAVQAAAYSILGGLGLALLAGLTLNVMPCVLPIIPLRIYSLVNMAGESRRRFVTLGLAFAGGIVLFFVGLAAVSGAVKLVWQETINLNFYFQVPAVRVAIAMVLLALSANLWGLFNVTVPSKVAALEAGHQRQGHLPATGMGVMMAVLSLPCSFWLMALALGVAQIQPLWLGTGAIVLIGVGMAAPHVVLAALPDLVGKLPRPGVWMEHFKQTMGFLLVPGVLYLLSTLPGEGKYPFRVAGFGVALVLALWMWGSWVRYDAPRARKLLVRGPALALVVGLGLWMLPQPAPPLVEFEPFDAASIDQARKGGQVVVVKVTAAWCTECKILEYTVFNTPEVAGEFKRRKIVAVEADVTDRARPANRWVEKHFGGAPPMTIVYPAGGGEPRVMVGRFTKAELFAALDRARGS